MTSYCVITGHRMVCYRKKMRQAIEVYSFLVRLLNYEDDVIASAEAALRRDSGLSLEDPQ